MLYNSVNPHGGDIYGQSITVDFSANVNPFGTPDSVKAAISASLDSLAFYPDPYCRNLVSAIAEYEQMPRDFVLCGNGASELIYSFVLCVKPKNVVELAPTFSEYTHLLNENQVKRFYLKEETGFKLTSEILGFIAKTQPSAVFICDPNNPTGHRAGLVLIQEIASLCKSLGAYIFIDECFADLSDDNSSFVPLLAEYDNVIVLKAFTKSFGMAGLRLGYCLSSNKDLLAGMARTVQAWNISTFAQNAGVVALSEKAFLEKTRNLIASERSRLSEALKACGLRVFDSSANFLLFKGRVGLDARLLAQGIKVRNCANYHGLRKGFYRVAIKLPQENDLLIDGIRKCL